MAPDPHKSAPEENRPTPGEGAGQPVPDDASPPEPTPAGSVPSGTRPRAPRELLRDFLYRCIAYVKARKLYPPGHERLAKQLASWLEAAEAVFAHQEEVSFFVQPEAVFVSGEEFGADDRIAGEFAPELVKRLVRYVSIARGVTAEELAALAEPLLLEPEALREAGGARSLLAQGSVPHLLVIEFSYDMGSYVASEEDVEVVRNLARYESGVLPEQYVLRRFGELGVSAEERERLARLLSEPVVARRLSSLTELLSQAGGGGESEVHASDLMLYVVRGLTEVEQGLGGVSDGEATQLFAHLLDRAQERLMVSLTASRDSDGRAVLSRVAGQMMASPEALLRWLAPDADKTSVTLSPDLAELLKAIFSRAESGRRRIRFGETVLQTLEAPEEATTTAPALAQHPQDRQVDPAALADRFAQLRQGLGEQRFVLDLEAVVPAHMDILLELLRHEDQPAARERILSELGTFVAQRLGQSGAEGLRLADRVFGEGVAVEARDLEVLLRTPEVCRQALGELSGGETRWEPALTRLAESHEVNFAAALGDLVLGADVAYPLTQLAGFLAACQDELVDWLQRRLDDEEHRPPLDRVVSLTLGCHTIRAVPLAERLLGEVGSEGRRALLRLLVGMDDARAVSVLTDRLVTNDADTRRDILYLLGESSQPLAEEALLAVATRSHWPRGRLRDRLTALSSLARCGSARSLGVLGQLAGSWLLGLTGGGRQVRAEAAGALRAVEARLTARAGQSEERTE